MNDPGQEKERLYRYMLVKYGEQVLNRIFQTIIDDGVQMILCKCTLRWGLGS